MLNGKAKVEKRGASTVVNLGKGTSAKNGAKASQVPVDQYVELAREKTDKIFVVLAEFGNDRHPNYPDQDTDPGHPGPDHVRTARCTTRSRAGPLDRQLDGLAGGLQPRSTTRTCTSAPATRLAEEVLREAVVRPLQRRRHGHRLGQGPVQRGALRPLDGYPCGGNVCNNTWALIQDAVNPWVADQKAAGRTDAQIKADLQSFDQWDRYDFDGDGNFNEPRRLHRPLPDRARRRRPGRRRPAAGRGRHLVAPLERLPGTGHGPGVQQGRRHPDRRTGLWVGDYTIQPENGGLCVFAHEYGHDLGLPDHYDTAGDATTPSTGGRSWRRAASAPPSDQGIGTKRRRPRRVGQAAARLAGLRDRRRRPEPHARARPARVQQRQGPGLSSCRSARPVGHDELRRARRRDQAVVVRAGRRPRRHDDPLGHAAGRAAGAARPSRPAGTSRTAARRRATTPTSRSNDGTGWKAIPGNITKAAEGNGIDGASDAGSRRPSTCRRTPARRSRCGSATAPTARRRAPGRGFEPASSPTRSRSPSGTTTVFSDGAETGANGWTLNGFTAVGASLGPAATTTTTWRRTATYRR